MLKKLQNLIYRLFDRNYSAVPYCQEGEKVPCQEEVLLGKDLIQKRVYKPVSLQLRACSFSEGIWIMKY